MLATLKFACLVLYAGALAGAFGLWRGPVATGFEVGAAAFAVIHVIELPFFFGVLRRYRGSLASSVAQALLFGMLHSLPLQRAARA